MALDYYRMKPQYRETIQLFWNTLLILTTRTTRQFDIRYNLSPSRPRIDFRGNPHEWTIRATTQSFLE